LIVWFRTKYTPGNVDAKGYQYNEEGSAGPFIYKYSSVYIVSDMKSAQRQDPAMNKNDDQAWLIGMQWIFIDKNKIITSVGPSQYDFK